MVEVLKTKLDSLGFKNINSDIVIVDNEISNDISSDFSDWRYDEAEIICVGFLHNDELIQIFLKKKQDKTEFIEEINNHLSKFNKKLFAFNYRMEAGNFKGFLKLEATPYIGEIKPFKGRGWSKDKFYSILVENEKAPEITTDPLNGNSGEVIKAYEDEDYDSIIKHNQICLIKEYYIFKYKDWLLDKFKDNIDSMGWYQ